MKQIVFFDGVCNLCNGFVDFIIRRDPEGHFLFSPLQGQKAKSTLAKDKTEKLSTVILWSQGQAYEKSDAALFVMQQLGGLWWFSRIFWLVPRFVRNLVYDLVARNRYRLFGKKDSCRLPTKEERARFLD